MYSGRRSSGQRARRKMTDETKGAFCPYCPLKAFPNIYTVRNHFARIHNETYCPICEVDFGHPHSLIDHIQWNHGPDCPEWNVIPGNITPSATSQACQLSPQHLPINHTQLAPEEHDLVLQGLLNRCHSASRLHRQNYTMPALTGVVAQSTRLLGQDAARNGRVVSSHATGGFVQRMGQGTSNQAPPPKKPKKRHALPPELFKSTPEHQSTRGHEKRKAVAIDCEMVEINTCFSELAYLSAVDFLTGEVLIDSFVAPTGTVVNWRTKTSGINAQNMSEAIRTGKALRGWHAARDKLWEFIDDQTVLVGHALENDLQVLGIFHHRIVDSSVVTAEAVFNILQPDGRFPRLWGLKKLAKALLKRDIQTSDKGHYALQDAYAARDIVLCAIQTPQTLEKWALMARKIEEHKQEERERAIEAAKKKKEKAMQQVMQEREEAAMKDLEQLTFQPQAQVTAFMEPSFSPFHGDFGPIRGPPNHVRGHPNPLCGHLNPLCGRPDAFHGSPNPIYRSPNPFYRPPNWTYRPPNRLARPPNPICGPANPPLPMMFFGGERSTFSSDS